MTFGEQSRDSLVMGLLAASAFVAWGLIANWHHGWGARFQVAATQGTISLLSTFFSAQLIAFIVKKSHYCSHPALMGGLTSYIVIYAFALGGHFVAGTPEFWPTVLPGMVTGVFFCFGYAFRVVKKIQMT